MEVIMVFDFVFNCLRKPKKKDEEVKHADEDGEIENFVVEIDSSLIEYARDKYGPKRKKEENDTVEIL
jgi:hypothetical protein